MNRLLVTASLGLMGLVGCSEQTGPFSTDLEPTLTSDYYVDQANKYFDALDESADPESLPTYSTLVARWEWPPWLLLTGFGGEQITELDEIVKDVTPATIPMRDCRFFDTQPFARCYVSFEYSEGGCPIYEEFTFNDAGEITFIEAWSDQPGMLPFADASDRWGEGEGVSRLSTRVPGLGNSNGLINVDGEAMRNAAKADPDVADFVDRTEDFWDRWLDAYLESEELFAVGCGWTE